MALRSLVVSLEARTAAFERGMNDAQRKIAGFERSIMQAQRALTFVAGAGGLAFATKKIFDLGAAAAETQNKFETVFGASADEMNRFGQAVGRMAGLSQTQFRDMAATVGAVAQGMGFAEAASAQFSQQALQLAGDLASFNNLKTDDTVQRITAALTGERESLKRLGIVILETDVQQRALRDTGKTVAATLTQQEKATATMALITERAGRAIGDLARTQDSAANRAKQLGAEFRDMGEQFAVTLLPAIERMIPLFQRLVGLASDWVEQLGLAALQIQEWTSPGTIERMAERQSINRLQGAGQLGLRRRDLAREQVSLGLGIIEQEELAQANLRLFQAGGSEQFLRDASAAMALVNAYRQRVEFVSELIGLIDARLAGITPPTPITPGGVGRFDRRALEGMLAGLGLGPRVLTGFNVSPFGRQPTVFDFGMGGEPGFGQRGIGSPFAFRGLTAPGISQAELLIEQFNRLGVALDQIGDASQLGVSSLTDGAAGWADASSLVVASLGSMAQAAIRGGAQMEQAIISAITQIGQALVQMRAAQIGSAAGPIGALIGAAGGILGAIFGGGHAPTPVRLEDVSDRAARRMADRGPVEVTLVVTDTRGNVVREQLIRRERRDAERRFGNEVVVGLG